MKRIMDYCRNWRRERIERSFVLVGKFLTHKHINFQAMQNVLALLWRPKEGMEVHDISGYRYSFIFFHVMDLRKVIKGGPWLFEQNMLVYSIIRCKIWKMSIR